MSNGMCREDNLEILKGMRVEDLDVLKEVAREYGLTILVRRTNKDSLLYIGRRNYYPKPLIVKAKTADVDPPAIVWKVDGRPKVTKPELKGLVPHPAFHPKVFGKEKIAKVGPCWNETMNVLAPELIGAHVDREDPLSRAPWGRDRRALHSPNWSWRIDVEWSSPHFGCLQLKGTKTGSQWCYLHGDYDLKDVIVAGKEDDNRKRIGTVDGALNATPRLRPTPKSHGLTFTDLQDLLNRKMGAPMIQHGPDAQFARHVDDHIAVIYPDKQKPPELLVGTADIQTWYDNRERRVLARPFAGGDGQ